jgi:hypothetical protein
MFDPIRYRPPPPPPPKPPEVKKAPTPAPAQTAAPAAQTTAPTAQTAPATPHPSGLFSKDTFVGIAKRALDITGGLFGAITQAAPKPLEDRTAQGVNDDSIGTNDDSIGANDDSIGTNDDSIGANDDSIGTNDDSIGANDDSIGGKPGHPEVGPESGLQALLNRILRDSRAENPSYLRPPPTQDPSMIGPPNIPAAQQAIDALPVSAETKAKLAEGMKDHDVAWRMASLANATKDMAPEKAAELWTKFAEDPKGVEARIISHVTGTAAWAGLTPEQKGQVADIFSTSNEHGMRMFGALAESRPDALFAPDKDGNTLLSNMAKIATQPLNPAIAEAGITREQLLSNVMEDIVNPERVDQGHAPTCTVTSMQYELVRDDPGEYARIMAGLTGPDGKATLRGGGELELDPSYVTTDTRDGRGVGDAIFQSAAMELANGADDFNADTGVSTPKGGGDGYSGLRPMQQTQMLEKLFGVSYTTQNLQKPDGSAIPGEPERALEMLESYQTSGANRPVILEISLGDWNHAVTFQGVEGDRVKFRDPYGVERSMSKDEFLRSVCTIHVPTEVHNDALEKGNQALAAVRERAATAIAAAVRWMPFV